MSEEQQQEPPPAAAAAAASANAATAASANAATAATDDDDGSDIPGLASFLGDDPQQQDKHFSHAAFIQDAIVFANIDLHASATIERQIPLLPAAGQRKMIPAHLRGCSTNPTMVVTVMKWFRHLSQHEQQVEIEHWNNKDNAVDGMRPRKRKHYTDQIDALEQMKHAMINPHFPHVVWETVARPITRAEFITQLRSRHTIPPPRKAGRKSKKIPMSTSMMMIPPYAVMAAAAGPGPVHAHAAVVAQSLAMMQSPMTTATKKKKRGRAKTKKKVPPSPAAAAAATEHVEDEEPEVEEEVMIEITEKPKKKRRRRKKMIDKQHMLDPTTGTALSQQQQNVGMALQYPQQQYVGQQQLTQQYAGQHQRQQQMMMGMGMAGGNNMMFPPQPLPMAAALTATATATAAKKPAAAQPPSQPATVHLDGQYARTVMQQNDARSQRSTHVALKAVANASDTIYYPDRDNAHEPRHTIIAFDINCLVENNATGGPVKRGAEALDRPRITVVGPRSESDFKWALSQIGTYFQQKKRTSNTVVVYPHQEANGSVSGTCSAAYEAHAAVRKQQRSQPSMRGRSSGKKKTAAASADDTTTAGDDADDADDNMIAAVIANAANAANAGAAGNASNNGNVEQQQQGEQPEQQEHEQDHASQQQQQEQQHEQQQQQQQQHNNYSI